MARWVLTCKRCGEIFTYSQISEALADYFDPEKPKFPPKGLECECPNCKGKSSYQRTELTFRDAGTAGSPK